MYASILFKFYRNTHIFGIHIWYYVMCTVWHGWAFWGHMCVVWHGVACFMLLLNNSPHFFCIFLSSSFQVGRTHYIRHTHSVHLLLFHSWPVERDRAYYILPNSKSKKTKWKRAARYAWRGIPRMLRIKRLGFPRSEIRFECSLLSLSLAPSARDHAWFTVHPHVHNIFK